MAPPLLDPPRAASAPAVSAARTGGLATLLLLLCQYRGVPLALWLLGVPEEAPEYQSAGTWLAPILAGAVIAVAAWLGSTLRDYVHAKPTANVLVRAIATVLPVIFLALVGCATQITVKQTADGSCEMTATVNTGTHVACTKDGVAVDRRSISDTTNGLLGVAVKAVAGGLVPLP